MMEMVVVGEEKVNVLESDLYYFCPFGRCCLWEVFFILLYANSTSCS